MKIIFLLFICQCCACGIAFAACEDDPRLAELPDILSSGNEIEGHFYLTGETFFRLRPELRKSLQNRIVICPAIPLNSKGQPMTKIRLSFPEIWEGLEWALNAGDWEQVRFIANSCQALPMPAEGLLSLLSVPTWNEKTMGELAKILGIRPGVDKWRFFLLDIFHALGGKAEKPEKIVWSNDGQEMTKFRTRMDALGHGIPVFPYSGRYAKEAAASLKNVGINFIKASDYKE